MTASFSALVRESLELEDIDIDVGGVGGTLAGNALSLAGIRATLSQVLTADAFPGMIDRASEWTVGVQSTLDEFGVPWQVTQLGARSEISFRATVSADGAEHHCRRCRAAHRRVPRGGSEPLRLIVPLRHDRSGPREHNPDEGEQSAKATAGARAPTLGCLRPGVLRRAPSPWPGLPPGRPRPPRWHQPRRAARARPVR
jgi:hypothetical protein